MAPAGIPHVLRVRVMAPFDLRVTHLGKRLSVQMGEHTNPRMEHDMARRDDTEKAGRMRYLYEVDVRDPAESDEDSLGVTFEGRFGSLPSGHTRGGRRHPVYAAR